ncbi:uncharacterized protein LAJ45_09094 [Morchella importuna]|uniref:uncharacterized protein n=1 Tax=Morchella importuna TaxID=1174673 RepID=UPI001E8E6EF8|nr:uncharacterized protein LAJ45_09094 [Morchella importuna]KAH8146720.1 hypothetical protein LAJ45_09094 [Morchella importuna]
MSKMLLSQLTVLSLLALEASAFWRLPCRQSLTVERIDPLTHFGAVSEHVHTIHGGNKFSQSATEALLLESTCTSCQVKQDLSAYWTPQLYFQDEAGMFNKVNQTGGMLVMIAGDPKLRSFPYPTVEKSLWTASDRTEAALRQKAVGFNCLNYAEPAKAALGLRKMPDNMAADCTDGLRAEVFFPSCWNGEDHDSDNHRDHMRYPSLMDDGTCPEGFETRLVSLFFETIWNVAAFNGQAGTFVFSSGDPLGYGYHGDFMNAWDVDILQKAIDKCTSLSGVIEECYVFDLYTEDEMHQCTIKPSINEDVEGPLAAIPGCNAVTYGPEDAPDGGCPTDEENDLTDDPTSPPPTGTATATATSTKSTSSSTESSYSSPTSSAVYGGAPDFDAGEDDGEGYYGSHSYGYGYEPSKSVDAVDSSVTAESTPAKGDNYVDPNVEVVVVTVTTYTTASPTTVTVHVQPTKAAYRKRHFHGRHAGHGL